LIELQNSGVNISEVSNSIIDIQTLAAEGGKVIQTQDKKK
jgi:hypothetical protein